MSVYIYNNQQTSGPFEEDAVLAWLKSGQLSPEALACRHGANEWQPLRTLFPGPAQPQTFAGGQPQDASPVPNLLPIANWARQNVPNRVEVKLWLNSIAAKVFAYGALLFIPAVILTVVVVDMFTSGVSANSPRGLLIAFVMALPFVLLIFVIQMTRRNIAKYLDAEGVETLKGKKHRWESLRHMNYKRVGRQMTVEMFFQTGKALIPSRTHNWKELRRLVETIPVPRRGA